MGESEPSDAKLTEQDKKDLQKFREEFEKHKDDLAHGPVSKRFCTDIPCCLVFILFCAGMVAVFVYGLKFGKLENITIGWDGDQNGCGYNETTEEYPFLYFPSAPEDLSILDNLEGESNYDKAKRVQKEMMKLLSVGVCVKDCPGKEGPVECKATNKMIENERCSKADCTCQIVGSQEGETLAFRYNTYKVAPFMKNGFCVPAPDKDADSDDIINKIVLAYADTFRNSQEGGDSESLMAKVESWIIDIMDSWHIILVSSVSALVLGYLYLFVIRLIGGLIIWLSIILIEIFLLGSSIYTFYYRTYNYSVDSNTYNYMTWGAYALLAMAGLVLILMCCCWHAIKIGIAVFKTTSQYVQANMRIFVLPILAYFAIMIWSFCWLFGAAWVFSIGNPVPRDDMPFATEVKWNHTTRISFFYDVFGLFWISAFIIGTTQFVIGCSACLWYFEQSGPSGGAGTVSKAFYWSYRYHLGSVAFGSFLIAVCQMMRFLFEYYRKKIGVAEKTKFVKAMICLTRYLLWLMENCVKFISKNAYIQVALTQNHFFKSAWNAFALVIKNVHRFGAAATIGTIYMIFGGLVIAAANGSLAYLFITQAGLVTVVSPIPPVVAVCVMSAFISYCFLSIFSFSSDAILQSFLLDEELRFAGTDRPEYMQEFAEELKNRGEGCCPSCC